MSYQVIARKYRPQRFSDVVGQDHVTQTLTNAIEQKRVAHAYLFVGPRGTGKTTIARIFAKCLNCTGGPKIDFADDDPRVQEITEGRSLDVFEIDGASNRGIEEIRELRETAKYAPAVAAFKIYIIDEVHMLTKEAFNALLKTLEEPPAHVKFMFATTEPEKVLATILSRCQRYDLRRIPSALIVAHLTEIARQERVEVDEAALWAVARGSEGCMRDAESTLDQLISFCGGRIVESDVLSMFGLAAGDQVAALAAAVLDGNADAAVRHLHQLAAGGKDLARLLGDLALYFRNILMVQISGGDAALIEATEAETQALKARGAEASSETLARIMEVLTDCEARFRDAVSKKILIEITLLKAIQARRAVSVDALLRKLADLRKAEGTARTETGSAGSAGFDASATPTPSAAKRGGGSLQAPTADLESAPKARPPESDLARTWTDMLEAVRRASPFARSYLNDAHPVQLAKGVLTVGFDPEFSDRLGLVDNQRTRTLIQTKARELGLGEIQVKFVEAEAAQDWKPAAEVPAPGLPDPEPATIQTEPADAKPTATETVPPPRAERLTKEEFMNDPLIKKALEIFKGQIVDVRG